MAGVEKKVQASTAAAATSGLALFILGRYVFRGDVPDVVTSWTYVAIPAVITFLAGYAAKHTARPVALPHRPAKTLLPKRGQDISPEPDPPMDDLPPPSVPELLAPPVAPPAAPE